MRQVSLYGAAMECGAGLRGPVMGPAALRTAGILETLASLGHKVTDRGDLVPEPVAPEAHPGRAKRLTEVAGWVRTLKRAAEEALANGELPVFLGGDHAMSAGTVTGAAAHAARLGKPLFVLWLDAHADFNTIETTPSGNLHGTPAAYFCGLPGFDGFLGQPLQNPVSPERVMLMGIRSVDAAEHDLVLSHGLRVHDMREIDEIGVAALLTPFLEEVTRAGGLLHLSLDVDFLDPAIAPAVGTTVPGGASFREAHLIMEMVHESGVLASADIAELNPFLDEAGRTARLMVDLAASLFGRQVMDRQIRSRWSRAA